MRNILTIAGKELRGYFVSPMGWVIMGLFALLFGYFFVAHVSYFAEQSMRSQQGGGPLNINQFMIRPLLQNVALINLFLLPMITMRAYAEEKRSGTMELLLTSPVSDLQIILGKFVGVLGFYAALLAVTMLYIGMLFFVATPEWKPLVTAYFGLLLMGGSFLSVGLFISSTTKNQVVAGAATFVVFLLLWIISWLGQTAGPGVASVLEYLSIVWHFDDFGKGVIDTKHVIYYLSFITFGLFLTMKSVDTERWRG
jgi:ABC-2 type transport system permease protein